MNGDDVDRWAFLHAALRRTDAGGAGSLRYPDTDNQMETGVFSFAKRDDEVRVWSELLRVVTGDRTVDGAALDVGCGLGAHAKPLRECFAHVILLDADAGRAQAAARNTGAPVYCARIDDGSLLGVPELAGAFAFVQMVQVLGHLPLRAARSALECVHHLLSPGGHVLVAVPFTGGERDLTFVTSFDASVNKVRPREVAPHEYDALARAPREGELHVRHFSMTSLLSAFAMTGFDVVTTKPYHWFSHDTGDIFALARKRAA